jgi:flagellin
MALSLVNNTAALNAQNNLTKTNSALGKSLERLSSGLKVNRGADGPAALVISEKQRAQIAGLKTAIDNTNKAVSLVQTGEGALNEVNSLLTKVRSLALDSANSGVNDTDSLAANQAEITNALGTITQIANTTQFGSKKLLDGSAGVRVDSAPTGIAVSAAPGAGAASDTYTLTINTAAVKANASATFAGLTGNQTGTLTINGVDINLTAANAGTQNDFINTVNSFSGQTGVVAQADAATAGDVNLVSKTYGSAGNFDVAVSGTTAGFSAGTTSNGTDLNVDVATSGGATVTVSGSGNSASAYGLTFTVGDDPATPFTSLSTGGDVAVTNNSLTFQIGANAGQTATIGLGDTRASALGQGVAGSQFASLAVIDVTTSQGAQDSLAVIDKAISEVSNLRGSLGAFQANTLETNVNNLSSSLENTTAAESVIRDTDFASEIANFTKQQTLLQAGSTVLGNANQITQLVAGLLRG